MERRATRANQFAELIYAISSAGIVCCVKKSAVRANPMPSHRPVEACFECWTLDVMLSLSTSISQTRGGSEKQNTLSGTKNLGQWPSSSSPRVVLIELSPPSLINEQQIERTATPPNCTKALYPVLSCRETLSNQ